MADYSQLAQGTIKVPAWSGSMDDLLSLTRQLADLAEYVRAAAEPDLLAEFDLRRAEIMRRAAEYRHLPEDYVEVETAKAAREREETLAKLTRVEMVVDQKRWGLRLSGTPAEIWSEITPDDVRRVDLELGPDAYPRRYRLRVSLSQEGVVAQFSGPETKWIDLVSKRLADELGRQRPKLWWIRTGRGAALLGVVALPAIFAVLYLSRDLSGLVQGSLVAGVGSLFVLGGTSWAKKLSPVMELYATPPPSGSRSQARTRRLTSLIGGILTAVVIPIALMVGESLLKPPQ